MFESILHSILEFFPVSSSTLMSILGFVASPLEAATLHLSTGIGALIYWFPYLLKLLTDFNQIVFYSISTIVPVIVGIVISQKKNFILIAALNDDQWKIMINIVGGFLLLLSTYFANRRVGLPTSMDGVGIAIAQSLAIIFPGVSRMGASLTYLFFAGFSYVEAFIISTVLAIPLSIGAASFSMIKSQMLNIDPKTLIVTVLFSFFSLHVSLLLCKFIRFFILCRIIVYFFFFFKSAILIVH